MSADESKVVDMDGNPYASDGVEKEISEGLQKKLDNILNMGVNGEIDSFCFVARMSDGRTMHVTFGCDDLPEEAVVALIGRLSKIQIRLILGEDVE